MGLLFALVLIGVPTVVAFLDMMRSEKSEAAHR